MMKKQRIPILKNRPSLISRLNKIFLFRLIKPKIGRILAKRSHRLLGINRKILPLASVKKIPEFRPKVLSFSNYLEPFALFSLHKKIPNLKFSIGTLLQREFLSILKRKNLKKVRRTKRRLFHKRIKRFKHLLESYYHWKKKMKKGNRLYKSKLAAKIKRLRREQLKKRKNSRLKLNESGIQIFNKLVQLTTRHGLKRRAYTNLKKALALLRKNLKIKRSVIKLDTQFLYLAVKKINPNFFIRKINLGRRTVFAPSPLYQRKKTTLSLRWILNSLEKRKELTFSKRLAGELEDVLKNKGLTIKFKKDQGKLAYDNRFNSKYLFKPK